LATFPGEFAKGEGKSAKKFKKKSLDLTHSVDFVEDWHGNSKGDEIVTPDPVVLDVVFEWELGNFSREGVWELHWTSWFCWCFGHRA
jgi:hypothetical protein